MAVPYYGDFAEDATVYIPFNTFSSDDPSASVTVTNLVNTDVHIHKNGGTTQRNNAAGITMAVDYDSITGNHLITIDTSDDTVVDFWVAAGEYQVRVEGTTIDGATINAWVGAFSIERAGGALALLKSGTYGLSAIKTDTAAVLADTGTDGVVVAAGSKTGYTLAATTGLGNQTANITGNLSGSVGSVTGAVGSVTGAVGSVAGNVDGSVASVTGAVTLANGAHGGAAATITLSDYSDFKATGFSTHSAADVKTAIEAGGGHLALIKAKTDNLPADPADDSDIDTQLAAIAGYIDTEITALIDELAKVPKSDSNVTWNATALASINAEVDTALNTAIPAAPAAGSMNAYTQQAKFVIKNKMEITEDGGATTIYKDDGTTPYCTVAAAFSSDSTTTTRKALE